LTFDSIHPDKNHNWINLADNEWDDLLPMGTKETKLGSSQADAIFRLYSLGLVTNRDEWVYDLDRRALEEKIQFFYGVYEQEKDRWNRSDKRVAINDFVDRTIKWTSELEAHVLRGTVLQFGEQYLTSALHRPFVKEYVYYDRVIIHRPYQQPDIFKIAENNENIVICVNVSNRPFNVLASKYVVDLHFNGDSQCFPLYRYAEDGRRVDNITAYALKQFQDQYDDTITRQNIFDYVYAVLHYPAYREKYKLNLKREFPHIPFYDDFWQWAGWGRQLMELHLNYETAPPYALERIEQDPSDSRAAYKSKLRAVKDKGVIELDTLTTLAGIPSEAWAYRLGNRSALEWILDRYKERKPKDPTIRQKFNTYQFPDYKEDVIDLLQRVCTVSVETMKIVDAMKER